MNEFVKRIIMEQIYSSEVLDGYKIDDKDSFCEEILSQIPEENHEAISNDEMSDYLVQLIKDTYNRNVVANKIFDQVEKSIKLKDKNKLVERMDVYSLVVSKISTDHYERIAKNKMDDELEKIVEAINISKQTNRIIKQNLMFSIGVKILILLLSLFGIADMWEAVFADVGTTLITIVNTLRILK